MTLQRGGVKRGPGWYTQEYVDCDASRDISDMQEARIARSGEKSMPKFNRTFELSIHDVDLIEEALRARGRELCKMRRALAEDTPADLQSIQVVEADQREAEELLGRLHNQKIFYRPGKTPYVSG
jgi:hypothetical protein